MSLQKSASSFDPSINTYQERGIGKFTVICGGRATLPNSWCNTVWTWLLILGPSVVQITFINPAFSKTASVILQITYVVTMVASLGALLATTCSDPGIVPRHQGAPDAHLMEAFNSSAKKVKSKRTSSSKVRPEDSINATTPNNNTSLQRQENDLENSHNQEISSDYQAPTPNGLIGENRHSNVSGSSSGEEEKSIIKSRRSTGVAVTNDYVSIVNGEEIRVTVCRTCNVLRPPRSFHCSDCNACIEVHDHHCPWVGTCVGKRNHRYFFLFSLCTTIHAVYTALISTFFMVKKLYGPEDEDVWNTQHLVAVALVVYTAMITCCVGGLMGYHGNLACNGVTTNEELRGKYNNNSKNPFDEGCADNCKAFWYGGTSRVYIQGDYDVESLSHTEPQVYKIMAKESKVNSTLR